MCFTACTCVVCTVENVLHLMQYLLSYRGRKTLLNQPINHLLSTKLHDNHVEHRRDTSGLLQLCSTSGAWQPPVCSKQSCE